jgi:hypothetical protein
MTPLVWLFFFLACFFSWYITRKITVFLERRKFKSILKDIDKTHGTAYHKFRYNK